MDVLVFSVGHVPGHVDGEFPRQCPGVCSTRQLHRHSGARRRERNSMDFGITSYFYLDLP